MNFFYYQPEDLASINIILGPKLFGWPAVLIFGIAFIMSAGIGYVLARRFKKNPLSIIAACAAVAWLPILANFLYSSVIEFNNTWFALNMPVEQQIIWRYCVIDKNQNLGGHFCAIYPFVTKVRELVPPQSSIAFIRTQASTYLGYYLYRDYHIVDATEAEYVIEYLSMDPKEKAPQEFELMNFLAPGQAIYKRK